ncbi:DUF1990 family protein [Epilithonimonas zeae]|uniref:DUF1990 domain-containing protein n=1 Tax=Epilithonimonas zeae TaxID=1416779 RepID=A0A1N6IV58_9FLAO|nr:DUF1990 family protein [Epilithonimonas zeae]SIO35921.1 protein of unknown function [Epilithonimonas zeae]
MKVYLSNQKNKFKKHLEDLKSKNVMIYDKSKLVEKITQISIDTGKTIDEIDLEFLIDYNIFPSNILIFTTQWNDENREMKVGDTILQQVFLPPIKSFSQKIIFGVRIKEIINEENKKGFSYETLEDHVEKGISTFTIEKLNQKIIFKIHTFSIPGNIFSKLLAPIFSIPYQTYCTKQALENVKQQVENQ